MCAAISVGIGKQQVTDSEQLLILARPPTNRRPPCGWLTSKRTNPAVRRFYFSLFYRSLAFCLPVRLQAGQTAVEDCQCSMTLASIMITMIIFIVPPTQPHSPKQLTDHDRLLSTKTATMSKPVTGCVYIVWGCFDSRHRSCCCHCQWRSGAMAQRR